MRVLLAIDGSPQSFDAAQALEYLALTQPPVVCHSLNAPPDPGFVPLALIELHERRNQMRHRKGKELIEEISARLPSSLGVPVERIEEGKPADAIIAVAKEEHVDLIVLGARGFRPIEETVFGSVSHHVLSEAPCSTLVVKIPLTGIKRVLLPLEGADDADAARAFLEKKPFGHGTQITIVTICSEVENARNAAQRLVDDFASGISPLGYSTDALVMRGIPGETIIQLASEMQPDIILMGSHGTRGLRKPALGSVSDMVLHKSHNSVAIFRIHPSA